MDKTGQFFGHFGIFDKKFAKIIAFFHLPPCKSCHLLLQYHLSYHKHPMTGGCDTIFTHFCKFFVFKGNPMNKSELIDAIAERADLSKADAGKALNAFIDSVSDAMKRGDDVVLVGFGTFSVKERAARKGRNPKTSEVIDIPASKSVGFKAGKTLKDGVNVVAKPASKGKAKK